MKFEAPEKSKKEFSEKQKNIENAQLYSAFGSDFIKQFTEIPKDINLNIKLKKKSFESYMDKVILSKKKTDYIILPGYLTCQNH